MVGNPRPPGIVKRARALAGSFLGRPHISHRAARQVIGDLANTADAAICMPTIKHRDTGLMVCSPTWRPQMYSTKIGWPSPMWL
jgi:hypothetical protein